MNPDRQPEEPLGGRVLLAAYAAVVGRASWLPPALLIALSLIYYGTYFNAGYNFSDEGNYAQFVYELFLGRPAADLPLGYGLLWFKAGEALFHIFGPDFRAIRFLFFACTLITSLLVYGTLVAATRQRWLGFAGALIVALVPPFLATAFYGLCVMLNVGAQMRLAIHLTGVRGRDALLAGAVLGLVFQIRPDFGYIFAIPLVVLLALAVARANTSVHRQAGALGGAALLGFLLAHLPGFVIGDSYFKILTAQYLAYPGMLLDYGLRGLQDLFGSAGEPAMGGAVLLQRPGLDIWNAPSFNAAALALLIYLPVIGIAAFVGVAYILYRRPSDRERHIGVTLVILAAGTAALPHYFFYRPDLSHIANFMPGYTVLALVLMWQALTRLRKPAAWCLALVLSVHLGLYLVVGLTVEGTGSAAGMAARTEPFQAENGVNVRLHPGEKALLEDLRTVIAAAAPSDAPIICVPYCPGIAFMTGHRLLFSEQYVDDTLPQRDPDWIRRAILETRAERPPVVIVMDWAINGTDNSRFSQWAAPYMEALQDLAREKIERPGLAIYLL